jgi:hypothetical protein
MQLRRARCVREARTLVSGAWCLFAIVAGAHRVTDSGSLTLLRFDLLECLPCICDDRMSRVRVRTGESAKTGGAAGAGREGCAPVLEGWHSGMAHLGVICRRRLAPTILQGTRPRKAVLLASRSSHPADHVAVVAVNHLAWAQARDG